MAKIPRVSREYISTAQSDSIRTQFSTIAMITIVLQGRPSVPTVVPSYVSLLHLFRVLFFVELGRNVHRSDSEYDSYSVY